MTLLENFIKNAKSHGVCMDISSFERTPYNLYCLDRMGKFIDCNESEAKTFGFAKQDDLLGLSAFDIAPENIAVCYQQNNQEVIKEEQPKITTEPVLLANGKEINFLSYKVPFRHLSNKILGIIGISFPINGSWLNENELAGSSLKKSNPLSPRQMECLYYLSRGMTIKQIAKALILSPKTVEHHLDAIKLKLNCRTRYELVTKAFEILQLI
jgi:PAS domain S-box-containing protein